MAVTYNLRLRQGKTFRRPMTYSRRVVSAINEIPVVSPVNIQGAKISLEILPDKAEKKLIFDTTTGHIVISDAINGRFIIHLKPETTNEFNWNKGKYELYIRFPTGDVYLLMEGTIICERKL